MRLGDFILANMEEILSAWEDFARSFWQGPLPDSARLRNDAETMILAVARDMDSDQTLAEQKVKSEGRKTGDEFGLNEAALGHALARVEDGFDIARMVAEFRALRASVTRLWLKSTPLPHSEHIDDLGRFHEALDQLVATSVQAFVERVDRNRRLFLGILGHDLRQPLYSIKMFTDILSKPGQLPDETGSIMSSMGKCCDAMTKMLGDMLDFTSTQLGSAMPVYPAAVNLGAICREMVQEVRATAPDAVIDLETRGELDGQWDETRLRQLVSNLLSNALQHGSRDEPVQLRVFDSGDEVTLEVHNMGPAIPEGALAVLFDPMVRMASEKRNRPQGSIGLGLYICRQIALAHKGGIEVESSAEQGTTFRVRLPKHADEGSGGRR